MTSQELAILMVEHANTIHPEYTHEQQLIWTIGILSDIVLEKNHMDNIVLTRLQARIDHLYEQRQQ
jgi:hypothetical protein